MNIANGETTIEIKISTNGIAEVVTNENGIKKSKLTKLSDLANMLSTYSSGYSPLLPEGTIKYGVNNGRIRLLISYDECIYNQGYSVQNDYIRQHSMEDFKAIAVEYSDDDERNNDNDDDDDDDDDRYGYYNFKLNTYLPKTLFLVDLYLHGDKYMINTHGCRLAHYFDDILSPTTKLYDFPFGNIYDNHELCFGGMSIAEAKYTGEDLRGLKSILFNWQSADSNLDLTYRIKDREDYRTFDHIYDFADEIKGVKTVEDLKNNSELYSKVRARLEASMICEEVTFKSFLETNMK